MQLAARAIFIVYFNYQINKFQVKKKNKTKKRPFSPTEERQLEENSIFIQAELQK